MLIIKENEMEYRFGDSGPKYLLRGPRANFGIILLKPGQELPGHYHKIMEEDFYVIEGKIEFSINGEKHILKAGELLHAEPGETHAMKNVGDTNAKTAFILAPYTENDRFDA